MMLVITAVMLLSTIDHTISGIWEVARPRPWYMRVPVYWVALTLGPVMPRPAWRRAVSCWKFQRRGDSQKRRIWCWNA